ncbi:MAG: hypothetical protein KGI38_03075 [Thaumarchaeota archaeon]|nr:hypothetical protein [Nitrososphaerota archaeon]
MNPDLSTILSLRRVLESASEGEGMARSFVEGLGDVRPLGSESARLLLLGYPIPLALRPLVEGSSDEVSMLAALIVSAPRSSTSLVGKSGSAFAVTLERWIKARENGLLEQKVMRFRSLVTSAVLGAVTAMVASLGPIVGSLNFGTGTAADPGSLIYAGAAMVTVSSGMLGIFMSGKNFFVNVALSLAVFALVAAVASPLASVPSVRLWGVK